MSRATGIGIAEQGKIINSYTDIQLLNIQRQAVDDRCRAHNGGRAARAARPCDGAQEALRVGRAPALQKLQEKSVQVSISHIPEVAHNHRRARKDVAQRHAGRVVLARVLEPPAAAAHQQHSRAAGGATQGIIRQVLLARAVATEDEQVRLRNGGLDAPRGDRLADRARPRRERLEHRPQAILGCLELAFRVDDVRAAGAVDVQIRARLAEVVRDERDRRHARHGVWPQHGQALERIRLEAAVRDQADIDAVAPRLGALPALGGRGRSEAQAQAGLAQLGDGRLRVRRAEDRAQLDDLISGQRGVAGQGRQRLCAHGDGRGAQARTQRDCLLASCRRCGAKEHACAADNVTIEAREPRVEALVQRKASRPPLVCCHGPGRGDAVLVLRHHFPELRGQLGPRTPNGRPCSRQHADITVAARPRERCCAARDVEAHGAHSKVGGQVREVLLDELAPGVHTTKLVKIESAIWAEA
eukprot:m.98794 g.98794  ORF g.98794 m.98794 type:complete len:472 (-) comp8702_c0_seq2:2328-3743(-)